MVSFGDFRGSVGVPKVRASKSGGKAVGLTGAVFSVYKHPALLDGNCLVFACRYGAEVCAPATGGKFYRDTYKFILGGTNLKLLKHSLHLGR